MTTSDKITITNGRLNRALKRNVKPLVINESEKIVKKELDKSMARLGKVTKFYPYLDKAEVKLLNSKKKVLCKLSHQYAGNIIDLYCPNGDNSFCDKLKEPCIIPIGDLNCVVLNIHDNDSSEYILISYYNPDEFVGVTPPKKGHARLTCKAVSNETYIDFGFDGLNVLSTTPVKTAYADFGEEITEVNPIDESKVYTKEEIDTILKNIELGDIDLSEFNSKISELENLINNFNPSSEVSLDDVDIALDLNLLDNGYVSLNANLTKK